MEATAGGKAYDGHEDSWKEKYLQMEAKMLQFHVQASEIRNKLAVKITTLTSECDSATARAEKAEKEVCKLRERMEYEEKEKDHEIRQLKEELKQEREILLKKAESWKIEIEARNEERALIHQKIARLKVWISAKLEEMEDQKKLLFEANERATTSLFEMKRRVQELMAELNELRQSTQSSVEPKNSLVKDHTSLELAMACTSPVLNSHSMEICSSPPPVPPHADKTVKHPFSPGIGCPTLKNDQLPFPLLLDGPLLRCETSRGTTSTTITISSVEEIKKDSQIAGTKAEIISENELINHNSHKKQEFTIDSKRKKKSSTLPKTRSGAKKEHSTTHHHSSLIETFGSITRKFRGFTESHQSSPNRGIRRTQSAGKKEGKLDRTRGGSKKHVSTPQIDKDLMKIKTSSCGKTKRLSDTLEEDENNAIVVAEKMEVFQNNSAPTSTYLSTSLPSPMLSSILPRTKRSQSMRAPRRSPPTPPLHQVPVWEIKICSLSKTGFQLQRSDIIKHLIHDSRVPIRYHSSEEKTSFIYRRDLPKVPVYTKLCGRIVLLRKTSFPDLSGWSDDNDMSGTATSELGDLRSMPLSDASTTIPWRRNGSLPGQARAVKRANSSHSFTSSEGDYSIPPDAISLCSDSSEPEHKLYKTARNGPPAAASSRVNSTCSSTSPENGTPPLLSPVDMPQSTPLVQEKCGILFKLSSYSFTWKKRYFILKANRLQYFLSPNNANQKQPAGEIALNSDTKLTLEHFDDSRPIFQISTEKKTFYISAGSSYTADDWIRALNLTLNRPRTIGFSKTGRIRGSVVQNETALKGWLEKSSKNGNKHKLWTCLGSSSLYFYTNECEQEFVGRIVLKDCKIFSLAEDYTICVKFPSRGTQQRRDVLLILGSKMEKDAWLYRLTVASGILSVSLSGTQLQNCEASIGTAYERLLMRIMYVATCASDNKDDSIVVGATSPLWRNQALSFSRDGSTSSVPLTTLSSEALCEEAVKLLKLCHQFLNSEIDPASMNFHVTIAQNVASSCLIHSELQGEIYAQLIKQCNGKFTKQASSMSPKHSTLDKIKSSTRTSNEIAVLQAWKLLSLIIPLFIPRQRMLWLLQTHLRRHADDKTEIGQYAIYCQRALARVASCGGRTSPPSQTEAVSIFLHNPYQHSLPFSMPVYFHDGKYQVMSFDASTTVAEFTPYICQQAGVRLPSVSGFALFTDDPVDISAADHYVSSTSKICDIISEWERAYRDTGSNKIVDTSRMVKVTLSQHLAFATSRECETEKEKLLIVYQVSSEIMSDRFPVTRELAIELAALCAQMDEGDMRSTDHAIQEILKKFYPRRYLENASKQQIRQLRGKLCERWSVLKSSPMECARVFLSAVRKCPIYGARAFQVEKCKRLGKGTVIWLTVHEQGFDELNYSTMEMEQSLSFKNIATYGGYGSGLVIVVDVEGTVKKHFYTMAIEMAAEIVHLMTAYMQATTPRMKD